MLREQLHQASGVDVGSQQQCRLQHDAQPMQRRRAQCFAVVDLQPAVGHTLKPASIDLQPLRQCAGFEGQALVPGKRLQVGGRTVPGEVSGRCAHHQAIRCQRTRHQHAAVGQRADAQRRFETLLGEVDHAVGQRGFDPDLRMARHVLGQCRYQRMRAEDHRRTDAQRTRRCQLLVLRLRIGFFHQAQDLPAAGVVVLAEGRHMLAPGGTAQQLHAQPCLQCAQMLAGHRRGDIHRRRRCTEAALVHDQHVDLHAFQHVHLTLRVLNAETCAEFINQG